MKIVCLVKQVPHPAALAVQQAVALRERAGGEVVTMLRAADVGLVGDPATTLTALHEALAPHL